MLQDKLKELAEANLRLANLKEQRECVEEERQKSPWYAQMQSILEDMALETETVDALRSEINALTIDDYLQTGNKKPAPGVGIRINTSLLYDSGRAFDYCVANLTEAIVLDKKVFEKYAKGVSEVKPLDFVTIEEKPTATIASDLTEYL